MRKIFYSFHGRLNLCILLSALGIFVTIMVSFQAFTSQIQEQISSKTLSLGRQVEGSIEESLSSIDKISRLASYSTPTQLYLLSSNPDTVIFNASKAFEYWNYAFSDNDICKNVYLYSSRGRHLAYNSAYWGIFREKLAEYGFTEDIRFTEPFFSDIFYISDDGKKALPVPEKNTTPYSICFSPVYSSLSPGDSFKNRIVSAILCDMTALASNVEPEYGGRNLILYSHDKIITTRGEPLDQNLLDRICRLGYKTGKFRHDGTSYLIRKLAMPKVNADFVYFTAEENVVGPLYRTRNLALAALVAVLITTVFLISLILRRIQKKFDAIVYDVTHVKKTNGPARIRTPDLYELKNITDSIEEMIDRLDDSARAEKENATKLLEAKVAQNNAELIGYRSQINPHFLFNTLECMRSMAHIYKAEPIEKVVSSMALMFRYSLYSPVIVTLLDEARHVESYLSVMKQRFPERFILRESLDPQALSHPMVSMILQPIVENSVQHAFPVKQKHCFIHLRAFEKDGILTLRITDNGRGMSSTELSDLRLHIEAEQTDLYEEKSSISLQNICRRLTLVCGSGFAMEFYSKKDCYTTVELRIPAPKTS